MKTLGFPTGSIGALLYSDETTTRTRPIAIPREFSQPAATVVESGDRWIHVAAAVGIALVVALVGYLVV